MPDLVHSFWILIASLCLFFAKHFIVDFVVQTRYQLKHKGTYGHPGGIIHSGLHAIGSAPAIAVFQPPMAILLAICGVEFLVHYHMDWAKDQIVRRHGWSTQDQPYWQAFGLDQFLHAMTYIAMAAVLGTVSFR